MRSRRLRFIAWALLGLCSLPASRAYAAVIQWTYSGVVGYGYDRAKIFGGGADLTGDAFTVVERFNTAHNAFRYVDDAQSLQFGGSQRGAANSASIMVTINGAGRSVPDLEDYIYSGSVTGKHLDFVKDSTGYEYAGFYVQSPFLPADYATAFTINAAQATFIGSYQFFSHDDPMLATYASFDVEHLTTAPVSGVPLPQSMALFGLSLVICAVGSRVCRRVGSSSRRFSSPPQAEARSSRTTT